MIRKPLKKSAFLNGLNSFNCLTLLSAICFSLSSLAKDIVRGDPIPKSQQYTVSECAEKATALKGKMITVQGKVDQVCAKKGCWFIIKDKTGKSIRITSKGYRFFVPPKMSKGKLATVHGVFEAKELDIATAQHYEDDLAHASGTKPKKVTKPTYEMQLAATGVVLK